MEDVTGHLQDIVRALQASDVRELEIEDGRTRIRVHRRGVQSGLRPEAVPADAGPDQSAAPAVRVITSPLVGTFYRAGKPDMPPLAAEGSRVEAETIVGIIEALQQLTEVEARTTGVIARVLATDGQPVEYGQVLFEVSANG